MGRIQDSVSILKVYNALMGTNYSLDYVKRNNVKCPFHDDAKASAHLYLDNNTFCCFSCKSSLGLPSIGPVKFVQKFSSIGKECLTPIEDAKKITCTIGGIEYKTLSPTSEEDSIYYKVYEYVAGLWKFLNKDSYFNDRGLTDEVINKYKLGYCPPVFNVTFSDKPVNLKDVLIKAFPSIPVDKLDALELYDFKGVSRYADRYTFPITDKYGRVVGFTARAKGDVEPKYYNTPGKLKLFSKRNLLYNLDIALEYPQVYIVEGTFDALSLISSGIHNVVAPLGTALTEEHLNLLAGKDIILALDNDKAGLNTMYKLIIENPKVHFNVFILDKYKDFNEALVAKENLKDIVKLSKTMSAIDYIIFCYKIKYDLSILANRVEVVKRVERLLELGEYHWLEKDYYIKSLKRLFIKMSKEEV